MGHRTPRGNSRALRSLASVGNAAWMVTSAVCLPRAALHARTVNVADSRGHLGKAVAR
jgi:hypothetical protein